MSWSWGADAARHDGRVLPSSLTPGPLGTVQDGHDERGTGPVIRRPSSALVAHLNPAPRGFTGAGWVYLGALIGLIIVFGTLLALAWLAV